mgnify:CR=1 FL=1
MLFAIGTRLVQRVSIPGLASPDAFFSKAMEHLEVIVSLHDLKNVQVSFLFLLKLRTLEADAVPEGFDARELCSPSMPTLAHRSSRR